jgi:hypothetical protein
MDVPGRGSSCTPEVGILLLLQCTDFSRAVPLWQLLLLEQLLLAKQTILHALDTLPAMFSSRELVFRPIYLWQVLLATATAKTLRTFA